MVAAEKRETTLFALSPSLRLVDAVHSGRASVQGAFAGTGHLRAWLEATLANTDRSLTPQEWESLTTLRAIQEVGRVQRNWADLRLPVSATLAREILGECAGDTVIGLGLDGRSGTLGLFGRTIALGHEQMLLFQARLVNQGALRTILGTLANDATSVTLHFAAGENDAAESLYSEKPRLLHEPMRPGSANSAPTDAALQYRPGRWAILTTPPLRAPIELAPTIESTPSVWRLDVPGRVLAKLQQLDRDERSAVLELLWRLQRRGGREFLDRHAAHAPNESGGLHVLSPTNDLRILLRPRDEQTLIVADLAYTETLALFHER